MSRGTHALESERAFHAGHKVTGQSCVGSLSTRYAQKGLNRGANVMNVEVPAASSIPNADLLISAGVF
jgi:hypothetical protein